MLTVADILAKSSDVGAIKMALRLGSPKFYDYIRAFGFGNRTGVDLPGESRGLVNRLEHWGSYSIASISMGQEVGVTPLQMVTAVSAIANGGLLYKPHIVDELKRGDTALRLEGPSAITDPKRIIRPETAATLRHLMEGVCCTWYRPQSAAGRLVRSRQDRHGAKDRSQHRKIFANKCDRVFHRVRANQ